MSLLPVSWLSPRLSGAFVPNTHVYPQVVYEAGGTDVIAGFGT